LKTYGATASRNTALGTFLAQGKAARDWRTWRLLLTPHDATPFSNKV
jgi:hypothetical protein